MRGGKEKMPANIDVRPPVEQVLYITLSFNPHSSSIRTYFYPFFMQKETDTERLSKLPRVTQLVAGIGNIITQLLFHFYDTDFLIKVS